MIRVMCPNCERRFRTQMGAMGKTAVCSGCKRAFKIGDKLAPFEWQPTDLGEDSWIGVPPPEEKKELQHCINCDAPLEDGQITCPSCSMNQITGLMRRAKRQPKPRKTSIWSIIPVRLIMLAILVLVIGLGICWGIRALSRSVVDTSDQLAAGSVINDAVDYLGEGGYESLLAQKYAGRVTDDNLAYFVNVLSSDDMGKRRAARLLIGCGNFTNVEPIVALTEVRDTDDEAILTIDAIGTRRLVELSCYKDEPDRRAAAHALCLLCGIEREDETIDQLAEMITVTDKIRVLNDYCRFFPQAVGTFGLVVNQTEAPFTIHIEQVGCTFYLRVGYREFRSIVSEPRTFVIPIDEWCCATGSAIDSLEVRKLLGGSVRLTSPIGAEWEGTMYVTVKKLPSGPLPGFLPFEPTAPNQTIELPIFVQ